MIRGWITFCGFALASACAAGTLFAESSPGKRKITEPTSELEGYFVRVKSAVSGEKQIYYNKDGTVRGSLGDGLLGGDFSLDASLLGDEEGDSGLNLTPEEIPSRPDAASEAVPAPAAEPSPHPPANVPATSSAPRSRAEKTAAENEGTVDEHSILRKFSKEKAAGTYRVDPENFKKVLNEEADASWKEAFSMRDWQGNTTFGMRRFSGGTERYEMLGAELGRGNVATPGRFEATSTLAGERMFVRNANGAIEVRINDRYSSSGRVFPNARARTLRESSGFSMQDINRYQFRRNRSDSPGLPVASPASGGNVRRENFGGGNNKSESE